MIVKCSHCAQMFSEENFNSHECDLPLRGCKRIEVVYFRDDSYKNKKLMTGRGTDGIFYTFEVVPRKAIPITMSLQQTKSNRFGWKDKNDGEVPEPATMACKYGRKRGFSK